jgi:CheY-like chemotaxis protein
VVIGARRREGVLRLEICDSGSGIPQDELHDVFAEFYQVAGAHGDRSGGLGLGLSIVERLCGLLDHRIEVTSTLGKGSRFTIVVPMASGKTASFPPASAVLTIDEPCRGKLVVMIDDDAMVREGMQGLLVSWGCRVVTAATDDAALAELAACASMPDLIISDYRLAAGKTGFEAVTRLRHVLGAAIPAFLISGDTAPERLREAAASGYHLLHKPVPPNALRAMVSQFLRCGGGVLLEGRILDGLASRAPSAGSSPVPRL